VTTVGSIAVVARNARTATLTRVTRETSVELTLDLDGTGMTDIDTGVGFFDHLLGSLAHHGLFDLTIRARGDLHDDDHHTVEDVALVLGAALAEALADRAGIERFGDAAVPMDEALATAVVVAGGRPYAVIELPFAGERAGTLTLQNVPHALEALARGGGITLHLTGTGRNDHHLAEAAFKALGRALRAATAPDPRRRGLASTKGST
jgi:imidazoleglycerol-phosphate dehydratase